MESAQEGDTQRIFTTTARSKSQQTYSHKIRNSRAVSLPALKPAPNEVLRTHAGDKLQKFRICSTDSWKLKEVPPTRLEELPAARTEQTERVEGLVDCGYLAETHANNRAESGRAYSFLAIDEQGEGLFLIDGHSYVEKRNSILIGLKVTLPVTSPGPTPTLSTSAEPNQPILKNKDEDDLTVLSQRPSTYSTKHDRRTGNGTRSLRRRPFLIFDKIEAKGYKQLEKTPRANRAAPTFRYQLGDGFSGREARPNGSNLLTRNGKLSTSSSYVGILDLAQSELPVAKRKRFGGRSNKDDNSFVPAPKKKTRRPLGLKDPNQQLKLASAVPAEVERSAPAFDTTGSSETEQEMQDKSDALKKTSGYAEESHSRATITNGSQPELIDTQMTPGNDEEVDIIIVQSSDDNSQDRSCTNTKQQETQLGNAQDSGKTYVSQKSPCRGRIRTRSITLEFPLGQAASNTVSGLSMRVLRRVNTQ